MISPSTADLLTYWDFEQDPSKFPPVWDQSQNGNHLTPNGFVVDVPGLTTGRVGRGLLLNGSNQSLSLSSNYAKISHLSSAFAAFFWYKPITLSDGASIISNNEWSVTMLEIGTDMFFRITIDGKALLVDSVPLIPGEWYFILLGYNGESIFASVNLNAVTERRSGISQVFGTFLVGGNGSHGVFDEFGIYRRDLTDDEWLAIYNRGAGLDFSEYGKATCSKAITCCK